jgi:general secretion pathway protein H
MLCTANSLARGSLDCQQSGYTLLELIVALVVAGLLIGLVPPLLNRGVSASTLRAEARGLAATLRSARSQAVNRQAETLVAVNTSKHLYKISNSGKVRHFSKGIAVKTVGARSEQTADHVQRFRFYPDGSTSGGQITLSGAKQKVVVDLNWLTGGVAVYD